MEFLKDIVAKRYAVKKFDGKMVDEKKISELCEMIRLSASSYGLQPWKIKVVSDMATKEKLQAASYNQPQVGTSSHVFVICADSDVAALAKKYTALMEKEGIPKENAEGFAKMVSGTVGALPEEKRLIWAQKQCYIAMGNALNGAAALGLGACPMEGFDPKQYSEILHLPKHLVPTLVVPVGHPADTARKKLRFESKEVFF